MDPLDATASSSVPTPPLQLVQEIPLYRDEASGVRHVGHRALLSTDALAKHYHWSPIMGRLDHGCYDAKHKRIFICCLGAGGVSVVDAYRGTCVAFLWVSTPQGCVFDVKTGRLFVSGIGPKSQGTVTIFREHEVAYASTPLEYHQEKVLDVDDADQIRLNPEAPDVVVVGGGEGTLTEISTSTLEVTRVTGLPCHPEGLSFLSHGGDGTNRNQLLINAADEGKVQMCDLTASGPVTPKDVLDVSALPRNPTRNFPIVALNHIDDEAGALGYYATITRNPNLIHFSRVDKMGETVGDTKSFPCPHDADDACWDPARKRLHILGGSGVVLTIQIDALGFKDGKGVTMVPVKTMTKTSVGARTGLYIPERELLYVFAPQTAQNQSQACLLVFDPRQL